jgi:hypothetical protein
LILMGSARRSGGSAVIAISAHDNHWVARRRREPFHSNQKMLGLFVAFKHPDEAVFARQALCAL